ncbi:hypothetical protein D9756_007920 [Leucocoprinus leucothites]|uniref:Uncharacterized protein n=1 Tax=Leucocoprinus leucothites TaxID=201217 RepID=A0A8H5D441_9AGAR|nr:hypothetical protein D9756_007920 [Leucoagaricus leucothites]
MPSSFIRISNGPPEPVRFLGTTQNTSQWRAPTATSTQTLTRSQDPDFVTYMGPGASSLSFPSTTSSSPTQPLPFVSPAPSTSAVSGIPRPETHENTNKIKIIIPICIVGAFIGLGIFGIIIFRCGRARGAARRSPTEAGRSTKTKLHPFSAVRIQPKPEMGEHLGSEFVVPRYPHTVDRTGASQLTPPTHFLEMDSNTSPSGLSSNNSTILRGSKSTTPNRLPVSKAKRNNFAIYPVHGAIGTQQVEINNGSEAVAQPSSQEPQLERQLLLTLMSRFEALEGRVEAAIGSNPPASSATPTGQPLLDLMGLEGDRPPDYVSQTDSAENREQRVNESRKEARS